jgi:hypothetical protein
MSKATLLLLLCLFAATSDATSCRKTPVEVASFLRAAYLTAAPPSFVPSPSALVEGSGEDARGHPTGYALEDVYGTAQRLEASVVLGCACPAPPSCTAAATVKSEKMAESSTSKATTRKSSSSSSTTTTTVGPALPEDDAIEVTAAETKATTAEATTAEARTTEATSSSTSKTTEATSSSTSKTTEATSSSSSKTTEATSSLSRTSASPSAAASSPPSAATARTPSTPRRTPATRRTTPPTATAAAPAPTPAWTDPELAFDKRSPPDCPEVGFTPTAFFVAVGSAILTSAGGFAAWLWKRCVEEASRTFELEVVRLQERLTASAARENVLQASLDTANSTIGSLNTTIGSFTSAGDTTLKAGILVDSARTAGAALHRQDTGLSFTPFINSTMRGAGVNEMEMGRVSNV